MVKTDNTKVQLFRSTQSSLIAYMADLILYIFMVQILSVPYLIARFISYTVGMTVSYFLSVKWIFRSRNISNRLLEYGVFAAIGMIGAVENLGLMFILKELVRFHHLPANMMAGFIVFFFNFFVRKILLFRKK